MGTFETLKFLRDFEKKHFPLFTSIQDFELVIEIGYWQEMHRPITPKGVSLLNVGPSATVERRLRRLRQLGLVLAKPAQSDKRTLQLLLSPRVLKTYAQYVQLMKQG